MDDTGSIIPMVSAGLDATDSGIRALVVIAKEGVEWDKPRKPTLRVGVSGGPKGK